MHQKSQAAEHRLFGKPRPLAEFLPDQLLKPEIAHGFLALLPSKLRMADSISNEPATVR
ncbi:hypothetical protein AB395_00002206 [Sinorhizobium fredii CCBAU 45436]|nr:hypothetical protein AB395_00002206 [Sinorhizobium fredii CCBAU 45436]